MNYVRAELDHLSNGLNREPPISDRRALLLAAQQALAWALEPDVTQAPFDYIAVRIPEGSTGYSGRALLG